ncbi:MAG: dTMP kinase [Bacillota bacterium]|jgi:dTMP kinase
MNEKTLKRNNKNNRSFKRQGLFITVEGPEGAGKSTQTAMLSEWLATMGVPVLTTREPGDGKVGAQIRSVILNPENTEITAKAEALLYAADRAQHVEKVLKPALEDNRVIICDRYVDSHLAYQGYGRGLELDFLRQINQMATGGLMPDLTILLNLDAEAGLARVRSREQFAGGKAAVSGIDRLEQEKIDFHNRLCGGYLELAAAEPNRIMVVDADRGINEIKYEIRRMVSGLLLLRGFINETNLNNEFFDVD